MPLRAPPRSPVPPPCWWPTLAGWLHLSEPQALRLWRLVSASRDPVVRAWRVTAVYAAGYVGGRDQAVALLGGPLKPTRVVSVLEALVEEGRLSRQEANAMEAAVLDQTTAAGFWT